MSTYTEPSVPMCINWHVTETCNYNCKHCFAKWGNQHEVWNNPDQVEHIIAGIANHINSTAMTPKRFRLNIVGGEPILQPEKLWNVVKTAKKYGAEVSMITNGSHLEIIRPFAQMISQVGISIDSFIPETNIKIGRACNGEPLFFEDLEEKVSLVRDANPGLIIKVNTVVNQYNYSEIMSANVLDLKANKWKILRQMPFGDNKGISDFMFYSFVQNNYIDFDSLDDDLDVSIEDNNAMTGSYLMISPDGRLFQNGYANYSYSRPLTQVSFREAMEDIWFNKVKFDGRYDGTFTWKAVKDTKAFFGIAKPKSALDSLIEGY